MNLSYKILYQFLFLQSEIEICRTDNSKFAVKHKKVLSAYQVNSHCVCMQCLRYYAIYSDIMVHFIYDLQCKKPFIRVYSCLDVSNLIGQIGIPTQSYKESSTLYVSGMHGLYKSQCLSSHDQARIVTPEDKELVKLLEIEVAGRVAKCCRLESNIVKSCSEKECMTVC